MKIEYLKGYLRTYFDQSASKIPILVTFTTKLFARNLDKIALRVAWDSFRSDMRNRLPHRMILFPLVAWAIESSVNSHHVHAIFDKEFSSRAVQKLWKKHFRYAGHVDVTEFDTSDRLIDYVLKSYSNTSPYLGQCVTIKPIPINSPVLDI